MINKRQKTQIQKTQKAQKTQKNHKNRKSKNKNKPSKFKYQNQKEEERKREMEKGMVSCGVRCALCMGVRSAQFKSCMKPGVCFMGLGAVPWIGW